MLYGLYILITLFSLSYLLRWRMFQTRVCFRNDRSVHRLVLHRHDGRSAARRRHDHPHPPSAVHLVRLQCRAPCPALRPKLRLYRSSVSVRFGFYLLVSHKVYDVCTCTLLLLVAIRRILTYYQFVCESWKMFATIITRSFMCVFHPDLCKYALNRFK